MPPATEDLFDRYVEGPPSSQNAVDALPGWCTALPKETGAVAGALTLTQDNRIIWMLEALGSIDGWHILELGPLDGGHTAMLHGAGAGRIDAVEANKLAFLRCLVSKNLLGLDRATFHLGDVTQGLGSADKQFDLIVASGILYHLSDPGALLTALAARTNRLFIWTHVYDTAAMPKHDPRHSAFTGAGTEVEHQGLRMRLHVRRYHGSEQDPRFCGGPRDAHVWMERADLLELLRRLGFDRIRIAHDDPGAPGGPALSILAERS
ncbi:MAG: class I SAM-dependent methyltransferase [Pseudomonadota bacterium]